MPSATPFAFHNPVEVRFGRGASAGLERSLRLPALIVTGRETLARAGVEARLASLDGVHVFPEVRPNPTPDVIDAAAARAVELGVRTVVGIGGGSALDVAKCVAAMLGHDPSISSFQRRCREGQAFSREVALVQLPTTAGTGSEVTRWASVWSRQGRKSSMDHVSGYADLCLVDPALSDTMGPRLTAATGLDALAHAMEALWGERHNPVSDLHARAALELVARHLLPCVRGAAGDRGAESDGGPGAERTGRATAERSERTGAGRDGPSTAHRDGMALAALHAGLALSNTASAVAHALSYALTGVHGVEHGVAVGLLCRAALPLNAALAPARVASIIDALGLPDVASAQELIDDVLRAAAIPTDLTGLGVSASDLAGLVEAACGAERLANNPGALQAHDLLALLEAIA